MTYGNAVIALSFASLRMVLKLLPRAQHISHYYHYFVLLLCFGFLLKMAEDVAVKKPIP